MKKAVWILLCCSVIACREPKKADQSQAIIDKAIEVSGGFRYSEARVSFKFRDINYTSESGASGKTLSRSFFQDSVEVLDILEGGVFTRNIAGKPVVVPDTMAVKYANSINSVHYFARLPYGLNDKAVMKRYLGESIIEGKSYHKIEVTFQEEGGGDDFDDVYVYWFNKVTYKPDYLAYEFHVDGGGMRFRKALNERYVGGIRFVDYLNYKPVTEEISVYQLDSLFMENQLELLSRIEMEDIEVSPGSYN
ncbi:deoxyribose-phosphate aldolase [Flavobacteriaceae bacterium D16]|nr:deoxyribose-phosphate aldolase [Flavobacteriaceae bacterium D16]